MAGDIWLTFPDGTEVELKDSVSIGRDTSNDLVMESSAVSREHATWRFATAAGTSRTAAASTARYLNGTRVVPGTPLPLRHADRISIGAETLVFSWPAQLDDPDTTEPLEEVAASNGVQLSAFQRQVVQALCGPWLAGSSLETLPSNEQIAAQLGTPGATAPSRRHCGASTRRRAFPISRRTRSGVPCAASHDRTGGSDERNARRSQGSPATPSVRIEKRREALNQAE
jgi:pSer/pThr/pTyr-binding forkhead associated (FHA) protein